jgi:hypothetical protein
MIAQHDTDQPSESHAPPQNRHLKEKSIVIRRELQTADPYLQYIENVFN